MNYHIITLFPQAFDSYLGESILRRAIEDKKIKVKFYNPRDFTRVQATQTDEWMIVPMAADQVWLLRRCQLSRQSTKLSAKR